MWIWSRNILAADSTDAQYCSIFVALYWGGFTIGSLVLVKLQLKFNISNFKMLIGNLFAGLIISGFLLLTREMTDFHSNAIFLWLSFPLLGFFTYGIFPSAISIPNDNRIWITDKAKFQVMIGQSAGEILLPLMTGLLVVLRSNLPTFTWIIFGQYGFGFIFFFLVLGYSMFSRDLAEMSKVPSVKDEYTL